MSEFSSEDRQAICETFERLLSDKANEEFLRRVIDTESGFDKDLWQEMAELGLAGIMVSPDHDGIGGSIEEVEALMEVAGAVLYNGPYISTCVIAPVLLSAAKNAEFSKPLLEGMASGEAIFAIAGCGSSGDWTQPPDISASNMVLTGQAHFVQHARNADHILVSAKDGDTISVWCVSSDADGLTHITHDTNDQTLRVSTLNFDNVSAVKLEGVGKREWHAALNTALVALAGEQAGATRRIFDITVEYLNTRYQFGQPIGRFQALKHMAADLLIEVESSVTVARQAARALAAKDPGAPVLTYLAAFTCADNFRKVAAEAIQLPRRDCLHDGASGASLLASRANWTMAVREF